MITRVHSLCFLNTKVTLLFILYYFITLLLVIKLPVVNNMLMKHTQLNIARLSQVLCFVSLRKCSYGPSLHDSPMSGNLPSAYLSLTFLGIVDPEEYKSGEVISFRYKTNVTFQAKIWPGSVQSVAYLYYTNVIK